MGNIETVIQLSLGDVFIPGGRDKHTAEIFNDARRRMVEVKLQRNAELTRHKAMEPISVFCLSGRGVFRAGPDLEDEQKLEPGTLLTLEAEVEHEVIAQPDLHLLVTKFKNS